MPGDEELAAILRAAPQAGAPAREQDRRPRPGRAGARVPPARARRPGADLRRSTATERATCSTRSSTMLPGCGPDAGRRGGDPRSDPRPAERRQVEPPERPPRRGARDRLRAAGHDTRRDRHDPAARRDDVRPRRHRRPAPQAPPAPGDRVLLGAPRARRGRGGRHRARARRRERGPGRSGSRRGRRRPQGPVLDHRRALEVGHLRDESRGRARAARGPPPPAARAGHPLVEDRSRDQPPARPDRDVVRETLAHASRRPS